MAYMLRISCCGVERSSIAVVSNFLADRTEGETFVDWVHRADEELLRGDTVLPSDGVGAA